MKSKTFLFILCLFVSGCVLLLIPILEISNVVAQPALSRIPVQNNSQIAGNVNIKVPSIGNASAKPSMLPYVNPLNGIAMLYPSDWQSSVADLSYPELIKFYSPVQNLSDFNPAQISIGVTKYVKNGITLTQYTNLALTLLNESQQQKQLVIDNSNPIMVAGNPGYKVIFSLSRSSNITSALRTMEIWTIASDKLYVISYSAEPSKFIKYLPQVNQMLDSIRISRSPTTSNATITSDNAVVDKIVGLCKQYQALCGSPICSSIAPSVGVDTASCNHALPAVRGFFNSHRSR